MDNDQSRTTKRPRQDIQPPAQPPNEPNPPPKTPTGTFVPDEMPDSTPIAYKVSGTHTYVQKNTRAQERNIQLGNETCGKWVGGMDPKDFLARFLPPANETAARPAFNDKAFTQVSDVTKEVHMYDLFIKAMSPYAPHLKLVDTHAKVDTLCEGIAVDVSAYQLDANGECNITKCDFSEMEIPIELKPHASLDPFVDYSTVPAATDENPWPFEKNTRAECNEIRGQIASYSSALVQSQFRLHCFSVFIAGQWARLLRWDRNGTVVSKRFLYAKDDTLVEFFWRYSHAPPHDISGLNRGHDPTVAIHSFGPRTSAEEKARSKLQEVNAKAHREFRLLQIPDRDDISQEYPFLIPTHRDTFGTRLSAGAPGADYWRSLGDNLEKEGDIYKILEDSNVPFLAPFGRGNDIRKHVTLTNILRSEAWAYPSFTMVSLQQYRMSLDEVGRPLNEFKSSYELVTSVADAMESHHVAYYDAKILHRDISAGNILISDDGRGMLIDWDLCLNMNNLKGKARRPDRTGTWQFLSAYLIKFPNHVQDVIDDMESGLWVMLWCMMRYTLHDCCHRLSDEMELFDDGGRTLALKKEFFLVTRHKEISFDDRPILNKLIEDLCLHFHSRYARPLDPDMREMFEQGLALMIMRNTSLNFKNPVAVERNLEDKLWLIKLFRKYLEHRNDWPANDAASRNLDTAQATARQKARWESNTDNRDVGRSSLKRQSEHAS